MLVIQPSFARGEISPLIYGRVDTTAYGVSLRTARNVYVHTSGGASNRPGSDFLGPVKDHDYAPLLVPFEFKTTDKYQLEFGDLYMRVIRDDAYVVESAKTITGITTANPPVVTSAAHGYNNGDEVYLSAIGGMTRLNGQRFLVANKTTNTFELNDQVDNTPFNASTFGTYTSGGTSEKIYQIVTPYTSADLDTLKFVQTADVMTITHPTYAPRELSRTGHASWSLATITFAPTLAAPGSPSSVSNSGSGTNYSYVVTAIADETFEESVASSVTTVSGGTTPNNTVSWSSVSGALRYGVYRSVAGIYGLIGETTNTSFLDVNIAPDLNISPPSARNPFNATDKYPAACTFFEQRRVFGGTNEKPDTCWYSQTGNTKNLNTSTPTQEDDAIVATLPSRKVNAIRNFAPGNDLIVFTSGSEWRINSGTDTAFSQNSIKQKPQSEWGSGHLPPILVGNTLVYTEENQARVRTLGYSLQLDGYTGVNLGEYSGHLLVDENKSIIGWGYAAVPESIIHMARNDGVMLNLTYNQAQEVVAWTRFDTDGKFERVSVSRRGGDQLEDTVYVVVKRYINGRYVRYVEKLHSRYFADVRDCFFVDSGLSYDNPVAITGVSAANPAVVTSTSHGLSNGATVDISDITWTADTDEFGTESQPDQLNSGRYTVANVTANTFTLVDQNGDAVDGSAFNAYVEGGYFRVPVSTVTGLDHLEGKAVSILADGNVVTGRTVTNGAVTLPRPFSRIHVGLRYTSDIETLDIESPQGTAQGLKKKINYVTVKVRKSRGLFVGPDVSRLVEFKQRENENMGDPTELLTGQFRQELYPDWNSNGRLFIRQRNPLPLTVLAVVPDIIVEDPTQ